MFNHHHHWTQVLTRTSLWGLLLGCAFLMSSPQTANATEPMPSLRHARWEGALLSSDTNLALPLPKVIKVQSNQAGETPKGGGLKGFVERLLDKVKKDKDSPPGPPEPSPTPTPTPQPTPTPTPQPTPTPSTGQLPGTMTFTGAQGGTNPANQTLSITNTGGGTLSWSASESASWLSLNPTSGTTTTETDTISVSVNTAGLAASTYTAAITLTTPGATTASRQVPVTLTVTPPPSTIGQSPTFLTFIAQVGGAQPLTQALLIRNTGAGTLSWSASETASWLTFSPASGTTTTETDAITVTVNTAGLLTNTYTAPITITASGASNTPQQVLVTVAMTAPASTKATMTWDPNTESDLAGYKVYVGTASGAYAAPVDVGNVTTFEVVNLQQGQTYYFAIKAYDTTSNQSGFSNEVSKSVP